jgi:hypothetical protein
VDSESDKEGELARGRESERGKRGRGWVGREGGREREHARKVGIPTPARSIRCSDAH